MLNFQIWNLRGSSAFENKLCVMPEWSLLNLSYGTRLECKKKGQPSPLLQAQQKRKAASGHHNKGVPAEYKPNNRGGAYHRDFYSAWQSPQGNTDRRNTNPHAGSPKNGERHSSPRNRFGNPVSNSPDERHRFSPQWNTPR